MAPPNKKKEVAAALPGTVLKIAAKTGLAESTVRRWLRELRADGQAHIGKRLRNVGGSTPLWVAGPGKDAPPLVPYTAAQYCRHFRKRVRKAIQAAEAGARPDERAQAISGVAQTIINTATVEVNYAKATGQKGSAFLEKAPQLPPGITGITQHRMR